MKHDADGFKKIFRGLVTSDFRFKEGDTNMGFDQLVGRIRFTYTPYIRMTHVSMQVLSVQEHGAVGSVEVRWFMERFSKRPGKKTHASTFVKMTRDTYRKVDGQWKMSKMSMWTEKETVDGKSMPTGGPRRRHR